MKQLMIFGDSVLKGVIYDGGKYRLCQDADFSSLQEQGVQITNRSKMGATILDGLKILERQTAPDVQSVALLEYGGNDCNFDWQQVSQAPDQEHTPKVAMEDFVAGYRAAIRKAKTLAGTVAVCSLMPLDPQKFMDYISQGNSYARILHWLGDVSMLFRWQQLYSDSAMDVAREEGCLVVDARREFMARHDFGELLCPDGIHPSAKGHRILRDALCRKLAPAFA